MNDFSRLIMLGAGGHAKVLADTLASLGNKIHSVTDPLQPASGCLSRYKWYANNYSSQI